MANSDNKRVSASSSTSSSSAMAGMNYYGVVCSLFYMSVIIAIGLPLWWKTTSPARHALPDISNLLVHYQMITFEVPICVVTLDDSIDRDELRTQLSSNWPRRISGAFAFQHDWRVRPAMREELAAFDKRDHSLSDIDDALRMIDGHESKGKLWIYILPEGSSLMNDKKDIYLFGRNRFVYVKNDGELREDKSLTEVIVEIVEASESLSEISFKEPSSQYLLMHEIDLIISIINENVVPDDGVNKKIEEIDALADVALIDQSGVSDLIQLKVMSQMTHYAFKSDFISTRLAKNSSGNVRLFDVSHVPELMNTIESRIVEHNNKQSHHIILYIPSSTQSPLLFYNSSTQLQTNQIATPNRGILIWNKDKDFVNGFRAFIRKLVSLPQSMPKNSLEKNVFFAKWELDSVMRAVCMSQIAKTLSSLESISKLIHKVTNIVIVEEISTRMHNSVDWSHKSIDFLAESNLWQAYKMSTKAYLSSETAFFDPSLLSLLYFPEDQKYAVYFPLFLPISLPLLSSLFHLYVTFKNRNKLKVD